MTLFLHCLFCAAVEITLGRFYSATTKWGKGGTQYQRGLTDIRHQTLRSLPAGPVILNAVFAPPNEYKLPASMSFRAGLPVDMESKVYILY